MWKGIRLLIRLAVLFNLMQPTQMNPRKGSSMEHRAGVRYQVDIAAYVRTHGGVVSSVGWLRDISVSGGFLRTTLLVPALSPISLRLIDAKGEFAATIKGQVVRCEPDGLGLEWSEFAPELVREWALGAGRSGLAVLADGSPGRLIDEQV